MPSRSASSHRYDHKLRSATSINGSALKISSPRPGPASPLWIALAAVLSGLWDFGGSGSWRQNSTSSLPDSGVRFAVACRQLLSVHLSATGPQNDIGWRTGDEMSAFAAGRGASEFFQPLSVTAPEKGRQTPDPDYANARLKEAAAAHQENNPGATAGRTVRQKYHKRFLCPAQRRGRSCQSSP